MSQAPNIIEDIEILFPASKLVETTNGYFNELRTASELLGKSDAALYNACDSSIRRGVVFPDAYIDGYGQQMDKNIASTGGKAHKRDL